MESNVHRDADILAAEGGVKELATIRKEGAGAPFTPTVLKAGRHRWGRSPNQVLIFTIPPRRKALACDPSAVGKVTWREIG